MICYFFDIINHLIFSILFNILSTISKLSDLHAKLKGL